MIPRRRVVVTGIGVASPIGIGHNCFWQRLIENRSGAPTASLDSARLGSAQFTITQDVAAVSLLRHIRHARTLTRISSLLVTASKEAVADARLTGDGSRDERLAVAVGIGSIELDQRDLLAEVREVLTGSKQSFDDVATNGPLDPLRRLKHLPNIPSSILSIENGAGGQALTFVGGNNSGLQAILAACELVESGDADVAICGGADSQLAERASEIMARKIGLSDSRCRPFDRRRNGTSLGEGAAVVVLEESNRAYARGMTPYAEIVAGGSTGPNSWMHCPRVLKEVLMNRTHGISAIIAHGDATVTSDTREASVISETFRDVDRLPYVTSIKGHIGHTLAASGAFNFVTAVLTIKHRAVPPIWDLVDACDDLPFVRRTVELVMEGSTMASAIEPCGAWSFTLLASCHE